MRGPCYVLFLPSAGCVQGLGHRAVTARDGRSSFPRHTQPSQPPGSRTQAGQAGEDHQRTSAPRTQLGNGGGRKTDKEVQGQTCLFSLIGITFTNHRCLARAAGRTNADLGHIPETTNQQHFAFSFFFCNFSFVLPTFVGSIFKPGMHCRVAPWAWPGG